MFFFRRSDLTNRQSKKDLRSRGIFRSIGFILLLLALGAGALFFPQAGRFLIVEERVTQADIALIPSGDPIGRSLGARDLYQRARIGRVLVIPEFTNPPNPELVKLGLVTQGPSLPQWSERILIASGVPRETLFFLKPVDGTINEAVQVRRYLRENRFVDGKTPVRLVLVTSRCSSRRARFIFQWILRDERVEVLSSPTPYDSYQPDRWWEKPRQALLVAMEYQKGLLNFLTLLLGLY